VGYAVYLLSAEKNLGMDSFRDLLKGRKTLITGHSGVGKSTLINILLPEKDLATSAVSEWSGKGMHTTTFAEMYDLPEGGHIIDTPGIRELGVIDIRKDELSGYYPEMKSRLQDCKYNNCLHFNEPGCAIKEAIRQKEISEERYINYLKIMDTIDEKKY
jgi:ribosome biogenesis GTPase